MTEIQKVIKYAAILFAIFLIVNIISMIFYGIYQFSNILGLTHKEEITTLEMQDIAEISSDNKIDTIKIELQTSNLSIRIGDNLKLQSDSNNISYKEENGRLKIKEENHSWFFNKNSNEIVLYIPEDFSFKKMEIQAGAGEINIEKLSTEELLFELGAGKVLVQCLNVTKEAKIEGGAGKIEILEGDIHNLDLDVGVGKFVLNTKLTGNNNINAGIGSLDIDLTDEIDNYTFKISKGIGTIKLNNQEVQNEYEYGSGETYIKIDGGIGNINIE